MYDRGVKRFVKGRIGDPTETEEEAFSRTNGEGDPFEYYKRVRGSRRRLL